MNRGRLIASAMIATCATLTQARAQGQTEAKLSSIEAQIRALQSELAKVKRDLAASQSEVRRTRTPRAAVAQAAPTQAAPTRDASGSAPRAAPQTGVSSPTIQTSGNPEPGTGSASPDKPEGHVSFADGHPTFTSGPFSASVGLQLHYDLGGYLQGNAPNAQYPRLNSFGQNLRRARLPFVFKYDDFQINVTPDFGGSPDGTPTLYEANFNYAPKGSPLTATFGYFKPWLTLGDSTSSNDFLFLERPSIVEASRNIAAGDSRASFGAKWSPDRYFIAAYLTGAPYGSQTTALAQPQQTGATFRVAGRPAATGDIDVHLGFSASDAFRIQRTGSGQTLTVQDRPELRIDNNRLVGTGPLSARSAYTYGPEFGFRYQNFLVQGEYVRIGVDRNDGGARLPTPGLAFDGGYVEGSWVITGEPRLYKTSEGAFTNPKVKNPIGSGGYGAVELVARYSHINLDDNVTRGIAAATTGGVYGGNQNVYSVGVNWYLNNYLRLMLDYDHINVDKLSAAGTTQIGQRINAVALRAQAAF